MAELKKPRNPRQRGRPGPSDIGDVRERILSTAERLFAVQGFAATAIRQIATEVGVNAAMVHYYFGSKQALLEAVMDNVLEPLAGSMEVLRQRDGFEIAHLTRLLYSVMAAHPFLPQLIAREVFLPGGTLQQHFLDHFAPRIGGRLPDLLRREQQAGRVDPELDPHITALLVLAMCFFPFIARPAAEKALKIRYSPAGLVRISDHLTRILEGGIRI